MQFKLTTDFLRGKKVVFYGDSITEGCKTTGWKVGFPMQSLYAYPNLLKQTIGFEYRNFAIGGSRFTYTTAIAQGCSAGVKTIYDHKEDTEWADVVVVAYGTNDYHGGAPIGELTDSPKSVEDVNTFIGAVDFATRTIKEHNPNAKICFLTPLNRTTPQAWLPPTTNPDTKLHLNNDYGRAIKTKISTLANDDIISMDMWDCFSDETFKKDENGNTIDGVHPNDNGHRVIADYIIHYYDKK